MLSERIKEEAKRLGFYVCGVARCEPLEYLRPFYSGFLNRGGHAGLHYLESYLEKRLNPELVLKGARSVIAVLMNYYPARIQPADDNYLISKHVYGRDYHRIMRERLEQLTRWLQQEYGPHRCKSFVDSGPVLEKVWANRCGVGWQGKNTLLIHKTGGSYFFIGIILTELEFDPDPVMSDHCGNCNRCVQACPTGALDHPYQLRIERCISYHTIELHPAHGAPTNLKLHGRIYGCDICQDICPYNRYARPNADPEFSPFTELITFHTKDWISLTEEQFLEIFRDSAVQRIGYQNFKRNVIRAAQDARTGDTE